MQPEHWQDDDPRLGWPLSSSVGESASKPGGARDIADRAPGPAPARENSSGGIVSLIADSEALWPRLAQRRLHRGDTLLWEEEFKFKLACLT